ncbi:MAG: TlpA disulfide reductase family protein [Myxococcota bacterium]
MTKTRSRTRFTLAALTLGLTASLSLPAPTAEARIGGQVPPFELPAAVGGPSSEPFSIGEHLGKDPVIILFWATWCGPCRLELPFYEALYKKYESQGLRVVAISMDSQDTVMQAGPAARRLGISFDVVTDVDTRVTSQINPRRSAPFSIWVNREGRIVWENEGFSPAEQGRISKGVKELMATPAKAEAEDATSKS